MLVVLRYLSLLGLCLFSFQFLNGAELRTHHQNVKGLGMGGVMVARPSTAMAFAWNPGYLAFNSGLNLTLFDAGLGLNGLQAYSSFADVDWGAGLSAWGNIYGKPLWLGAEGLAALSLGQWGIYYNKSYDLSLVLNDPVLPVMDASYLEDEFYMIGYGFKLTDNLGLGFNIKNVVRKGGQTRIGTTSLTDPSFTNNFQDNIINSLSGDGIGYGIDWGVVYRLNMPFSPTLSFSWRDFGITSFSSASQLSAVQPIRDNVTLGAYFFQDLPLIGVSGGVEYRHAFNYDEQMGKKIHLGGEIQFLFFDIRAGLSQGYPSYGLGFDFWLFQMDIAYYTNEMGVYPGQTPQERLQLGLNMDLSFDPDFNLIRIGGERRQLKKRR